MINFVRNFEALPDKIPERIHLKMPGRIPKTILGENLKKNPVEFRLTFIICLLAMLEKFSQASFEVFF